MGIEGAKYGDLYEYLPHGAADDPESPLTLDVQKEGGFREGLVAGVCTGRKREKIPKGPGSL